VISLEHTAGRNVTPSLDVGMSEWAEPEALLWASSQPARRLPVTGSCALFSTAAISSSHPMQSRTSNKVLLRTCRFTHHSFYFWIKPFKRRLSDHGGFHGVDYKDHWDDNLVFISQTRRCHFAEHRTFLY